MSQVLALVLAAVSVAYLAIGLLRRDPRQVARGFLAAILTVLAWRESGWFLLPVLALAAIPNARSRLPSLPRRAPPRSSDEDDERQEALDDLEGIFR